MGVPTSAVGYTAAMFRREDHEMHKDMWWGHWTKKKNYWSIIYKTYYVAVFSLSSFPTTL